MQTVILAAGEGSRMRPLTEERPRPMLPVAGRPLVEHVLDGAVSAGASMLVVVVGYEADAVRCALGDEHRGVPIVYAVKERPRETADAVRAARPHLEVEPFAVLAADNLYDEPSLDTLFNHVPSAGTAEVADPRNYGVFEIEPGRVTGIVENPEAPPPLVACQRLRLHVRPRDPRVDRC